MYGFRQKMQVLDSKHSPARGCFPAACLLAFSWPTARHLGGAAKGITKHSVFIRTAPRSTARKLWISHILTPCWRAHIYSRGCKISGESMLLLFREPHKIPSLLKLTTRWENIRQVVEVSTCFVRSFTCGFSRASSARMTPYIDTLDFGLGSQAHQRQHPALENMESCGCKPGLARW